MRPTHLILSSLSEAVKKRPAMYFGRTGADAIPKMVQMIVDQLLEGAPLRYLGPVAINVSDEQVITITFRDLTSKILSATTRDPLPLGPRGWAIAATAGASSRFTLYSSDGKSFRTTKTTNGRVAFHRISRRKTPPLLRISFIPDRKIFGALTADGFYQIAGRLKHLGMLRPRLATRFHGNGIRLGYYYHEGLKSFLFEEDYFRWPSHQGCISFHGKKKAMQVEGHLRFVHAGVPHVDSFVHFSPSQGGSHLEGLGLALEELFPSSREGCRELAFVTNPDTGAVAKVPRSFVGALSLQVDVPRFRGPTKDVLEMDEVRDFVHNTAFPQIKTQWESLKNSALSVDLLWQSTHLRIAFPSQAHACISLRAPNV